MSGDVYSPSEFRSVRVEVGQSDGLCVLCVANSGGCQ